MGFPRQEYWGGLPFPSLVELPDPGIKSGSPALQAESLLSELPGKPNVVLHIFNGFLYSIIQFSSVQLLSLVRLSATPWIAARQDSLSITDSRSLSKLMPIESVMPSSHLILCRPLLLLPPIPPSIRIFSNESALCMRWPKYWSFSLIISPSNEHPRNLRRW